MIYGSVYGSIHESTLSDVVPYEFDESMSFQEMGAQMIEEATSDWNDYMQAIALTELSYVIETGQEYIYEGVDIGAMIDKIKEWFKKLWAKIQGIAKAAMAKFAQYAMSDEKFISKYESDIHDGARKIPNGFSYKGYKFPSLEGKADTVKSSSNAVANVSVNNVKSIMKSIKGDSSDSSSSSSNSGGSPKLSGSNRAALPYGTLGIEQDKSVKAYGNGFVMKNESVSLLEASEVGLSQKQIDELLDKYRASICNKSGKVSSGEFRKAVKIDLYGSADKEYIRTVDASKLISIIKGAEEAKSAAKEAESDIKESIDEKIETLDELEDKIKSVETEADDATGREIQQSLASYVNRASGYLKSVESINAQWFSMYLTALKDQNRQAKAVCTKLISYANGVGAKKESAAMSGSILEDRFAALDF